jgi:UDPglucose--hexose-1-phosphate uridylyltransferase
MSTVRRDPLTGDQVVVAPERIPPPPGFGRGRLPTVARCPFCPGQEHLTERELGRRPHGEPWLARAFPNRRPGLHLEAGTGALPGGLPGVRGRGAHEVVVVGRGHEGPSSGERTAAWHLVADRMADLAGDPAFAAIGAYRNRGEEAGSTQPHAHAQVVASPVAPPRVEAVWRAQAADPARVPALVEAARTADRTVLEGETLDAWCPWAPAVPFAVRLAPRASTPHLAGAREAIDELGPVLHRLIAALDALSGFTSFNLVLTAGPPRDAPEGIRWILDVLPRVVAVGGYEAWSGGAMHPIDPVDAASTLRDRMA